MKAYTIKPLNWRPHGNRHFYADALGDTYIVYFSAVEQWTNHATMEEFDSADAAKAACQADYERRLEEWLSPIEGART